jgi:hypothetical protein
MATNEVERCRGRRGAFALFSIFEITALVVWIWRHPGIASFLN